MASFSMNKEFEVVEEITSETLERVRLLAVTDTFKARSVKYRHPRFKNRFSPPLYTVSFRCVDASFEGRLQTQAEDSMEALDRVLRETYLEVTA